MNKGIIPINKPQDWTSFDVVNKLKHLLKMSRVGHLGTLDPMATGVLLVTVGKATKLFNLMQDKVKTYIAKFEFGYETDTLDSTGEIIRKTDILPTKSDIEHCLKQFIGEIEQIPPRYSAKSINGKRAYDLARNNVEFEIKPSRVKIYSLDVINFTGNELELKITCGSGTYIRSIGRDIAKVNNSLATMVELTRTNVGDISLNDCYSISDLSDENINSKIKPISEVLKLPILEVNSEKATKLLVGQTVVLSYNDGNYLLNQDEDTVAIVNINKNKAKMSIFLGD